MKKRHFVALARVSSREQEREGFSLDVQEEALRKYAERENGKIIKLFRIAETASKQDERTTFKEMMAFTKKRAQALEGILFYKVDRAARNLVDYVEIETFEEKYGVRAIFVSQPTENTPAGRMMRRTLANMASFYVEQQALDVRDGLRRRVENGLFVGHAPYGYRNVRKDGRSLVEVHPENSLRVARVFELYAYHNHTVETLGKALYEEGTYYSTAAPKFPRSKLHGMLRDRAYIGEVRHKGQWYEGTHKPLVSRVIWDRVQVLLGNKVCRSHEMTYSGELITCGHCGHPITGERKFKKVKGSEREYVYYRCSKYNKEGHPRVRIREADLDQQVIEFFARLKIEDAKLRTWFPKALRAHAKKAQESRTDRAGEIEKKLKDLKHQRDRLLNLRLAEEIETDTFAAKDTELRDRQESLKLALESCDRGHNEYTEIAVKAFELSQSLEKKWVTADYTAKRQILELICLNFLLEGITLRPTLRKPFDLLENSAVLKDGRGGRI